MKISVAKAFKEISFLW